MIQPVAAFDRIGEENAFAVLARATDLANQGRDIINLGIGQPDFKTPAHIVEAAVKALRDGHHGYTPANGLLQTREAVCRRTLTMTGVEISPDSVMIMPGGKPTMYAAIRMLGEPGVDILYPDPGFPIYRSMIEHVGARPIPVPMREENGFAFSAEETLALITPETRLLILNSPANPTGGVTPKAEIDKLVAGLAAHPQVAILSDEIYDVMTYDGESHTSLLTYPDIRDRLIVLNGWSKTWAMTGWRMGWSIWPNSLIGYARKLAVNCWSCVNAPSQFAGIAAIDGPQDTVTEMLTAFDRRRKLVTDLLNALPGVSCVLPKGAFYAFPNISATGWKAKPLASTLLDEAGVALIGGPDFGVLGEGYIRVSCANSDDNIEKAIVRVGEFLEKRKP
ncbi:MAG: pyridoxal phosphate-dependent aminotransferase [Hoeflea sp.]|uniref:pyridoxal phosphate-dependent aminotransferase n=1 Tax=Hoeflea sp. TaxID=1940281 RepID=UPI001DD48F73|nr:pyridoxal phosphate-dependent aminotransferase [Hoeflea sp.]MBU4528171.1 pyridoxal phosphate-dependent aminotransferase [Alphaproteobacteria bacterium]MBU4543767.1 pyridoxal phosphate-dependent aminotransferase [Alphaproteobacteria bacterium]MBU4548634.1 pyridoxal phosphate-dependent aminotransferase [Alphaproteobacteria bacterium]MBV1725800.1 pyridoxal phosphate-dependent aminotransferase [Hoeflea sp.]MBV1762156.1 pyridoxal phosphate-dependent aminotransferase [Hoeflea sp.]